MAVEQGVGAAPRVRPKSRNRTRLIVAAVVVLLALGFLVTRALGDSIAYFKTADEAVRDKTELGEKRFRIEGVVVDGTVREAGKSVRFDITENGATVSVVHEGDPPDLFKPNIPVVLEGRWDGDTYASDRIMVKHTNEYREENPERLRKAGVPPQPDDQ